MDQEAQPYSARDLAMMDWLVQQGLDGLPRVQLLTQYCARLVDSGVPLMRMQSSQSTMHPRFGAMGFQWERDTDVTTQMFPISDDDDEVWLRSPFFYMLAKQDFEVHADLTNPKDLERFRLFYDLRALGGTAYFGTAKLMEKMVPGQILDPLKPPHGMLISWTTDAKGGFAADDLRHLRVTLPHLALTLKSAGNRRITEDLMSVYLGQGPGQRVMSGEILRGSLERISAAIVLFDISGFTTLTETRPAEEVIELLNAYFGIVEPMIAAHGGNVLKFMGDGLLAMFDQGAEQDKADAALALASELRPAMEELSGARARRGQPTADFTLALHQGDILYGNIGSEDRLDFTVIGAAVNMTARLSGMHRALEQQVIVSEAVRQAAGCDRTDLVALGQYMLRGISTPQALYTLYGGVS